MNTNRLLAAAAATIACITSSRAHAATIYCDNIHALRIMQEENVADCDTSIGTVDHPISGANLPAPHDVACTNMTPNECADYFYDYPTRGLKAKIPGQDAFSAYFPTTTARCADGTKPMVYFDAGSGDDENKWIFWQQGGSGKCGGGVDRVAGTLVALPERCLDQYASGDAASSFRQRKKKDFKGIMNHDPLANPDFNTWNRVAILKCSNDQYIGRKIHGGALEIDGSDLYKGTSYSQGHLIVEDTLDWFDTSSPGNDLSDADVVVFWGSSGGGAGLIHSLDDKADYVSNIATTADIYGLIDSRAEPALSIMESRYDDNGNTTCSSIYPGDCAPAEGYDDPPAGLEDAGFPFDTSAYEPFADTPAAASFAWGSEREKHSSDNWNSDRDASCKAYHGDDSYLCFSGHHVLEHHLATPVFLATSTRDTNQINNNIEVIADDQLDLSWDDLGAVGEEQMSERVAARLQSYADDRDNVGGGAHGEGENAGEIGVWATRCREHEVAKSDAIFNGAAVGPAGSEETLMEAFSRWLGGDEVVLIDDDGATMQSINCP